LVERVYVTHVVEGTEGEVVGDPALAVHEGLDSLHEVPDLVLVALGTSTEVLASELGGPDGVAKGGVHVLEIADHGIGVSAIEMDSKTVNSASAVAGFEELLHPGLAGRSISAGGGDKLVTLVLERLDVLLP